MLTSTFDQGVDQGRFELTPTEPGPTPVYQDSPELHRMSVVDDGEAPRDFYGFSQDSVAAATSLADLALSGSLGGTDSLPEKLTGDTGTLSNAQVDKSGLEAAENLCRGRFLCVIRGSKHGSEHSPNSEGYSELPDSSVKTEEKLEVAPFDSSFVSTSDARNFKEPLNIVVDGHSETGNWLNKVPDRTESACTSDDSFCREIGLEEKQRNSNSPETVDDLFEGDQDNIEEADEKTRCPCGNEENFGTMIQCDQCKVWQHARCVGFRKLSDIPEQYFCEKCRPDEVRENSIIFKRRSNGVKRPKRTNTLQSKRNHLASLIKNSDIIKSYELKSLFLEDLRRKYSTSCKHFHDSNVFEKYAQLLKKNSEFDEESVVAGLETITSLPRDSIKEKLEFALRLSSNSDLSSKSDINKMPDCEPADGKPSIVTDAEKVRKRKRSGSISMEFSGNVNSSREERKMQQIVLQFKRLEEREERRKQKASGNGGQCVFNHHSDNMFKNKSRSIRSLSVDSDEKNSSGVMEIDEDEIDIQPNSSVKDSFSGSSREVEEGKGEEKSWDDFLSESFIRLPGPSIVGSTAFSSHELVTSMESQPYNTNSESSVLNGHRRKERLLKLFRETFLNDRISNYLLCETSKVVSLPLKKRVLTDLYGLFVSPTSSSGGKTCHDSFNEFRKDLLSTMQRAFADDSKSQSTVFCSNSTHQSPAEPKKEYHSPSSHSSVGIHHLDLGRASAGAVKEYFPDEQRLENSGPQKRAVSTETRQGPSKNNPQPLDNLNDFETRSTFSASVHPLSKSSARSSKEEVSKYTTMFHNNRLQNDGVPTFGNANRKRFSDGIENVRHRQQPGGYRKHSTSNFSNIWSTNRKFQSKGFEAWRDFRRQNGWI